MITVAFDPHSPAIIEPDKHYGIQRVDCDACVLTFSYDVVQNALKAFDCHTLSLRQGINGPLFIYGLRYKGRHIAFYLSMITAAAAGTCLEEARCILNTRHFISFGSCGILDCEIAAGKLVVPTEAYRDEGLSYHYRAADSYIPVRNAAKLAALFGQMGLPHISGRAWTTDALYRETRNNMQARRREGCIAVDMECSGLQALCDFRGLEYYPFFIGSDLLDCEEWDRRILGLDDEKMHQLKNFYIALEVAAAL